MKSIERLIENVILASRWILVVFYLGLAAALAIYAVSFAKKLYEFLPLAFAVEEADTILAMLKDFGNSDSTLVKRLGVVVASLGTIHLREIVECRAQGRMISTERLLQDSDRTF